MSLKTITVLLLQFVLNLCISTNSTASNKASHGWHASSIMQLDYAADLIEEHTQELAESEDDDEITYKLAILGVHAKNMACKTHHTCSLHKKPSFSNASVLCTFSNLPPPVKQAI